MTRLDLQRLMFSRKVNGTFCRYYEYVEWIDSLPAAMEGHYRFEPNGISYPAFQLTGHDGNYRKLSPDANEWSNDSIIAAFHHQDGTKAPCIFEPIK